MLPTKTQNAKSSILVIGRGKRQRVTRMQISRNLKGRITKTHHKLSEITSKFFARTRTHHRIATTMDGFHGGRI
jgi:hypothetical protein